LTQISIGVCCYNEEKNIANLLENLINHQKLQPESEILVVCSGCTDSTEQIVREYGDRDSRIELIIEEERKGKASALNKILERYNGEYLFLIPGDVLPAKYCLPLLLDLLASSHEIGVACAKAVPVNGEIGFIGYLSHLMWRMHHRTLSYLDDLTLNTHVTGELMVMRRIIQRIPIDVINEDAYIGLVATSKNFRARYCDDAVVFLKAPSNILDFIKQRRRVIYGHYRIKALTGRSSRTLESMVTSDPNNTMKIVASEIREFPKDTLKFMLALGLEGAANFLAMIDLLLKREHILWSRVDSTKTKVNC
jgi:biofilm PGA synthesis N-glycosyltransferase PgaC